MKTSKVASGPDNDVQSFHLAEVQLKYRSLTNPVTQPQVNSSDAAAAYLRKIWNSDTLEMQEEFLVLLLNAAKRCIGWSRVSIGGSTATIVDPAQVFRIALLGNAHTIVVAHNHPSGNITASQSDIRLTKRLAESGKLLGVSLLDHIIITSHDYVSLAEKGLL